MGLRALSVYASTVGFALIGNKVMTKVRADVYRHLHSLSLSFHTKARKGDLTVRVIGDIGLLKDVVVTALLPMIGDLAILTGMIAVLFWLNWQLALIAMATVPLFWLSTVRLTNKIHKVSRAQRARRGRWRPVQRSPWGRSRSSRRSRWSRRSRTRSPPTTRRA